MQIIDGGVFNIVYHLYYIKNSIHLETNCNEVKKKILDEVHRSPNIYNLRKYSHIVEKYSLQCHTEAVSSRNVFFLLFIKCVVSHIISIINTKQIIMFFLPKAAVIKRKLSPKNMFNIYYVVCITPLFRGC